MRAHVLRRGYSPKTFESYWKWVEDFLRFSKKGETWVHPDEMGEAEVERYLTHIAIRQNVSPTTQNLALQSILFLYRNVLNRELQGISAVRSKRPRRVPTVLSQNEVGQLLGKLTCPTWLVANLIYGSGLRIGEALAIRIKDIDFERKQLCVKSGKGNKDRVTCLPPSLFSDIRQQIERIKVIHRQDVEMNRNGVSLPYRFDKKAPGARLDVAWYYLFCSENLSFDPNSKGPLLRHHIHSGHVNRVITKAAKSAGIMKRVTSHTVSYTHLTLPTTPYV